MRISRLRHEIAGGRARVSARVEWEDCARPSREVFYEAPDRFAGDLEPRPDAFLVGGIVAAARHGERRIAVEGAVSPRLRDGLRVALSILQSWYGRERPPIAIEPSRGFLAPRPAGARHALFLSGGLDSLFTLRANRRDFSPGHPGFFRDGIFLLGHDAALEAAGERERRGFEIRTRALERLAESCGLEILPMSFNLRDLDEDLDFYIHELFGAALASAGHVLALRIRAVTIASSYDVRHLIPCASHILLDPHYSSGAVSIAHHGAAYTRLEKLREVAEWSEGLRALRVCSVPAQELPPGVANCGMCEKCLRTRVGLLVLGRLAGAPCFAQPDLTAEELSRVFWSDGFPEFWGELAEPLRRIGRSDLAEIVEDRIASALRYRRWASGAGWKGRLRRFDRRRFGGALLGLSRRVRSLL